MKNVRWWIITGLMIILIGIAGIIPSILSSYNIIAADIEEAKKNPGAMHLTEKLVDPEVDNLVIVNPDKRDNIKIEIKRSDDKDIKIETNNIDFMDFKVNREYHQPNRTLKLILESEYDFFGSISEIGEVAYNKLIGLFAKGYMEPTVIISVPNSVNITTDISGHLNLKVKDSNVLKDKVSINAESCELEMPYFHKFQRFTYNIREYAHLDVRTFINSDEVNIKSNNTVYITEDERISDDKIIKSIPLETNINANLVEIRSITPIGKTIDINSDTLMYEMPFERYKTILDYRDLNKYNNVNGSHNEDDSRVKEDINKENTYTESNVEFNGFRIQSPNLRSGNTVISDGDKGEIKLNVKSYSGIFTNTREEFIG